MFDNVYKGLRVFITGHTGFKGFWLTTWLLELGAETAGWSSGLPTEPSGFRALGLERRISHFDGDMRDREGLEAALKAFAPDIIFNLAAQALVRKSYADPVETFAVNAAGTLNLLEAVRNIPSARALVLITSDKCYRNDEWVFGYRETDRLGGKDPYSASKACAEIIAHSYFHSFFNTGPLRAATARAGNVIGGGDWAEDRIVPDCARAFAERRPVIIRNPEATRPWQHVLEPLSGYLRLGARLLLENTAKERGLHGEAFNFGPPAEVKAPVGELAKALLRYWPGFSISADPDDPDEDRGKKESTLLKLCCDKALALLDWKAVLSFSETVRFTALWYNSYYQGMDEMKKGGTAPDMYALTVGQIGDYCALARERNLAWAR